jgi:hypothetical protein
MADLQNAPATRSSESRGMSVGHMGLTAGVELEEKKLEVMVKLFPSRSVYPLFTAYTVGSQYCVYMAHTCSCGTVLFTRMYVL